jgi:hypothetical protein
LALACTAAVIIEAILELAGRQQSSALLTQAKWNTTFAWFQAGSKQPAMQNPTDALGLLPGLCAAFCLASVVRVVVKNADSLTWKNVQDLLGVFFGGVAGVWLWCHYAGVHSIDPYGPVAMLIVSVALLCRTSLIFPDVLKTSPAPRKWHTSTWWRFAPKKEVSIDLPVPPQGAAPAPNGGGAAGLSASTFLASLQSS